MEVFECIKTRRSVRRFKDKEVEKEKIEKLSEPTNSTKADGLGLGLQIVRSIIENHGGKIFFSQAASGGLRVEIRLPAEETTEQ